MKTSIIEVADLLSVLTVEEVEKRFGEVPGVGSATVDYAAANATVRYDETLLEVADIKVLVHLRGQQSADDSPPQDKSGDKPAHKHGEEPHGEKPMPQAAPDSPPAPAAPKTAMPAPAAGAADGQEAKPAPDAPPAPSAAAHHH